MRELKHLNILYIKNSNESEALTYLEPKCSNLTIIENLEELTTTIESKSFDILISEKSIDSFKIRDMRSKMNTHMIIIEENIDDMLYLNAINLQGIKFLNKETSLEEFREELKEVIQTLDSNDSNVVNLKEEFVYDKYNNTLLKNRQIISLSKKEDMFLDYIISNQNRAISYEELNDTLWKGDMTHNALRSVVKEVRKKTYKDLVKNISGVGYRVDI